MAGVDSPDSASLSILLRDDAGDELVSFIVGLGQTEDFTNINNGANGQTQTFALNVPSLADLAVGASSA